MRLLSVALHEKRKPQPSPVEVLFRRRHERAGWSWADAMRATERNADAEKTRPEQRAVAGHQRGLMTADEFNYERGQLAEGMDGLRGGAACADIRPLILVKLNHARTKSSAI